jgi:ABC-type antimicrobial peptide transport system permease subunit
MAIGATADNILALVVMQGIRPIAIGLISGLAGSLAVNHVLQSALLQVSPGDPLTYVVASAILLAFALLGCLVPVRRAMRVDPVVALRNE